MAKEFTIENATAALEAAVEAKGEDYLYPRTNGGCYYALPNAEGVPQPSCIVGHVIYNIDPELFRKVANFEEDRGSSLEFASLVGAMNLDVPVPVIVALASAQRSQDFGEPWGYAQKCYKEYLARYENANAA